MSVVLRLVKGVYRAVLPLRVRRSAFMCRLKARFLWHDAIYDEHYYQSDIESAAALGARSMSNSIIAEFNPKRVIDVGCGTGALLEALRDRGCEILGLENSDAALAWCRTRRLSVAKFDLEKDGSEQLGAFDMAISVEVAEHLPERIADRFVDFLTELSGTIVFTAAQPGQGGTDHVNEQPPAYWIAKFEQRGFKHDVDVSERWRESWRAAGDVVPFYYQNLIVFRRAQASGKDVSPDQCVGAEAK